MLNYSQNLRTLLGLGFFIFYFIFYYIILYYFYNTISYLYDIIFIIL